MNVVLLICPKCAHSEAATQAMPEDVIVKLHQKSCGGVMARVARLRKKEADPAQEAQVKAEQPPLEGARFVNEVAEELIRRAVKVAVKGVGKAVKKSGRR